MQTFFLTVLSALLLFSPQAAYAQGASDSVTPDMKTLLKPVSQFVSTTTPLTSSQQDQLDAFTMAVARQMGSSDTSEVMEARNRCNELLDSFGTSDVFRQAFAKALIEKIQPILDGDSQFNRFNAYRVLGNTQVTESNEALADQLKSTAGTNEADRAFASNMLSMALKKTDPGQFQSGMSIYLSIITSILSGASNENNWVALQREFECLVTIASNSRIGREREDSELRNRAIQAQAMVLDATLKRLDSGNDMTLARAVPAMVLMLRGEYINLDRMRKQKFTAAMTPSLIKILETGRDAWDKLQGNAESRRLYGDAVFQAAVLTRLVTGSTNAPKNNPDGPWRDGKKDLFDADVAAWTKVKNP
jgi:hypothetical protein